MNLILLDSNNIKIRQMFAHKNLYCGDTFTGGLYGYLMQLVKLDSLYHPCVFLECCDGSRLRRKQYYTDYKGDRKKGESNEQINKMFVDTKYLIDNMLDKLNIGGKGIPELEADDIISYFVLTKHTEYDTIVVVSNDDDLYSLLEYKNVIIYKASNKIYTYDSFKSEFPSLEPSDWRTVKALCGGHNNIKPVKKGIGLKTAIKIFNDKEVLKKYKEMEEFQLNYMLCGLYNPNDMFWRMIMAPLGRDGDIDVMGCVLRETINFLLEHKIDITPQIETFLERRCK